METEYYKQALEEYKELKEEQGEAAGETEGETQDGSPDDWDKRIDDTGCYVENMALQLCHAETGDWRQCMDDMARFRDCWEKNGNRERVSTVDKTL
ncbi:Coa4p KNAG_0B02780 [Huiozyma naganishii CBS 8797]|uniref:CHCH domain-containing protein n=1 Tax=Huiozyma naganishii (strain ATCC MYA-139 / BCRC 22969 / CBS 8797 / KCTC 17520 / NBRC 10181 / NCYC 3082 / Yp74L-3) TaxID=1071383 RepID=J7S4Q2_HUIN7|nr:hypothetical protein KNAG_0B02780 [Kazachstania naganishii CBS 8797]CCK68721.1 hypothetical protein KNAG_0B02780 [Kazachstania naganishii CBS 8797]